MSIEQGNLSINSENFLPIIKKWLYTDKDIFVRELVSNGCDAVAKHKKLVSMGEATILENEKYYVKVILNETEKTIEISDNGIGMTDEEIKKYINQIAFSGAEDFIARYKDKAEDGGEIIGHFGLGFYSAFMVSERVEIDTLSYAKGAKSVKWSCEGGIEYSLGEGSRTERGTSIILHISEDSLEFLKEGTMASTLRKYCAFMPVEVFLETVKAKEEVKEGEDSNEIVIDEPTPINDTTPLWLKQPNECTENEYRAFYHKVFFDMNEPLFWIHLNMDYPFRLKGILYFPKIVNDIDAMNGAIKLYCNQVYIADNIKEVVPEFLMLLKGVMDCPDMPLNVSRSTLQNDGYSAKMSGYISKKVADRLNKMFKDEREAYTKFWDDINLFIKYGCIKENKFYDKVKDSLLFKTTEGVYKTINEYTEDNKDKNGEKLFYVSDLSQQSQYIKMFKEQEMEALILDNQIDKSFINFLEMKEAGKVSLARIDSFVSDNLKENKEVSDEEKKSNDDLNTELENLFRGVLGNKELIVKAEGLKTSSVSSILLLSEETRRIEELREIYKSNDDILQMFADVKPEITLVLNKNNSLIKQFLKLRNNLEEKDKIELICHQLYDLALMTNKTLTPEEMTGFVERSNRLLELFAQN